MCKSTNKEDITLLDYIETIKDRDDLSWFQKCTMVLDFKKMHDLHLTVNPFDYLDLEKTAKGLFEMIYAEANGKYEDVANDEVL